MIADHDRSGWIGASDTAFVIGNWKTKTWENWWRAADSYRLDFDGTALTCEIENNVV